jgi:hypothetical protein
LDCVVVLRLFVRDQLGFFRAAAGQRAGWAEYLPIELPACQSAASVAVNASFCSISVAASASARA